MTSFCDEGDEPLGSTPTGCSGNTL